MSCYNYDDLCRHIGHEIECISYGETEEDPQNVSIECITCNEVLLDSESINKENDCHCRGDKYCIFCGNQLYIKKEK